MYQKSRHRYPLIEHDLLSFIHASPVGTLMLVLFSTPGRKVSTPQHLEHTHTLKRHVHTPWPISSPRLWCGHNLLLCIILHIICDTEQRTALCQFRFIHCNCALPCRLQGGCSLTLFLLSVSGVSQHCEIWPVEICQSICYTSSKIYGKELLYKHPQQKHISKTVVVFMTCHTQSSTLGGVYRKCTDTKRTHSPHKRSTPHNAAISSSVIWLIFIQPPEYQWLKVTYTPLYPVYRSTYSDRDSNMHTPRSTQWCSGCDDGIFINIRKFVEWPVVARTPAQQSHLSLNNPGTCPAIHTNSRNLPSTSSVLQCRPHSPHTRTCIYE